MNPKVTIIVPTYNRYELLKKCMKSLLEQTYENIEIIEPLANSIPTK